MHCSSGNTEPCREFVPKLKYSFVCKIENGLPILCKYDSNNKLVRTWSTSEHWKSYCEFLFEASGDSAIEEFVKALERLRPDF